jgi:hypothetical protein
MFRSAVSKAMWVGRATVFMVGLAVILALLFGLASMAFAANGDAWRLGRTNVATAITRLGGQPGVNGPMVSITNNNGGTYDTALDLVVEGAEPPMTVNSSTKVQSLHADFFDGKDSSSYVQTDTNEFLRNSMFEYESSLSTGTADGSTHYIDKACPPELKTDPNYGPRLLSGGFKDIDPGTTVLESYPTFTAEGEVWRVRTDNNSTLDSFRVVAKCTNQRQ